MRTFKVNSLPYRMETMTENRSKNIDSRITNWLWGMLIVGFVLFSLSPTFYELKRSGDLHADRQFELIHNFPTDYNFYLSRIREGLEGRWTSVERYTSEPHAGSLVHEMYVLMGRVGRASRVPWHRAGDIYHVARIVLAIAFLVLIAEFCKKTFAAGFKNEELRIKNNSYLLNLKSNFSILAFLLVVTASSWSKIVYVEGVLRLGGYMPWWSVMDSLQRITFIPHLLAGQALIIFLLLGLTHFEIIKKSANIVFLGFLGLLLGMIFPPGLVFLYVVMGVYALLHGKGMVKFITPYFLVFFISMPSLVYLGLMTSVYPWKRLIEVDIIRPLPFDYWEYVKAIGPIGITGLIGFMWAFFRKEKAMYPAVSWVISWIGLLFVFKFIPAQSPLRFSEMIPHVPLGILTAYLFFEIGRFRKSFITRHLPAQAGLSVVIPMFLIVMGLLHMYSSWLWQRDFVDHKIRATTPLVPTGSYVMYPLKDFISAIVFIQDSTPSDAIILSETTAGNYIPVYSGNRVYLGHDNTVNFESKKEEVKQFFSGNMPVSVAKVWLNEKGISRVYYGPQEQEDGGGKDLSSKYPFLINRYTNPHVTVYSIE